MPSIDLKSISKKVQGAADSLGIDKGATLADAKAALKKAQAKFDSGIG